MYRRGPVPVILDHKFSSDIHANAKKKDELIQTVQLPIYVQFGLTLWPDATEFEIGHHNVSRKGVDSFLVTTTVTRDQVLERVGQIETVVRDLRAVALAEKAGDVPAKRGPQCEAFAGCPHQAVCSAFKEKIKVSLTAEEMDLFNPPAPTHTATTSGPPAGSAVTDGPGWTVVECEVCKMPMTALGKRPPGHKIDPSLCPNKASHEAAQASKPAPTPPPEAPAAVLPPDAPPNSAEPLPAPAPEAKPKRGRPTKAEQAAKAAAENAVASALYEPIAAAYMAPKPPEIVSEVKTPEGFVTTLRVEFALSADTLTALRALVGK
jgi:hypothetical protein